RRRRFLVLAGSLVFGFLVLAVGAAAGHRRGLRDVPHRVDEVPRLLVLLLVAVPRDGPHHLLGHHVGHLAGVARGVGQLEVDHGLPPRRAMVRRWPRRR